MRHFTFQALAGIGQRKIASRPHKLIKEKKVILEPGDGYILNQTLLVSPDSHKQCLVFNLLSKEWHHVTSMRNFQNN